MKYLNSYNEHYEQLNEGWKSTLLTTIAALSLSFGTLANDLESNDQEQSTNIGIDDLKGDSFYQSINELMPELRGLKRHIKDPKIEKMFNKLYDTRSKMGTFYGKNQTDLPTQRYHVEKIADELISLLEDYRDDLPDNLTDTMKDVQSMNYIELKELYLEIHNEYEKWTSDENIDWLEKSKSTSLIWLLILCLLLVAVIIGYGGAFIKG